MGDIIKGARHYIAGLLWFASSGAGIVLIKVGTGVSACAFVTQCSGACQAMQGCALGPHSTLFQPLQGALRTSSSGAMRPLRTHHPSHCCLQESLTHLHAPAILLFFHLLPSVATVWVMHQLQTATALSLGPFTARSFRGSLVPTTLYGVQVMLLC